MNSTNWQQWPRDQKQRFLERLRAKNQESGADLTWPTPPALHEAQAEIVREARRFNVLDCGVRFGKTTLCQWLIYDPMKHGYPVAWYAPTFSVLEEVWRSTRSLFRTSASRISDSSHRVDMPNGGVLEMWSMDNPDASMGRKYKRVVIDEAAAVRKLQYSWETVIRARLMDYQGDAYFISTPRGYNYFKTLFDNERRGMAGWKSFQYPTTANPHIKAEEIEEARRLLPERTFREMYLAEFVPGGRFFYGVEQAAVITQRSTPEEHRGHNIFMGVDWGQSVDFTVIVAVCRECGRVVDWDRINQVQYQLQRDRVKSMWKRWNARAILPERNSIGQPNIESLRSEGIPIANGTDHKPGFNTTAISKAMLIERLALAIGNGSLQIPKEFLDEFLAFEIDPRDGSPPKYGAPDGMHDDEVMGTGFALWLAQTGLQLWV